MKPLYFSDTYVHDLRETIRNVNNFAKLKGRTILITGAGGLVGSFIADVLLEADKLYDADIKVYACGRNIKRLKERFSVYKDEINLHLLEQDVNNEINFDFKADYVIHAAGNAYPDSFKKDPVGTIMSNVLGTYNLLRYCRNCQADRFVFISSGEVYGDGNIEMDSYKEDYSGYINPLSVRSCYPMGKRAAETLCISYAQQFNLEVAIARLSHSYGPNITDADNRASAQFLRNVINEEDIILKSRGNQRRSYCYISDCVSGILTIMMNGEANEAYNVANKDSIVTIAELAEIIAKESGRKVIFKKNNQDNKLLQRDKLAEGDKASQEDKTLKNDKSLIYETPIRKAVLNAEKLENLGWTGRYGITKGIDHTLKILNEIDK